MHLKYINNVINILIIDRMGGTEGTLWYGFSRCFDGSLFQLSAHGIILMLFVFVHEQKCLYDIMPLKCPNVSGSVLIYMVITTLICDKMRSPVVPDVCSNAMNLIV